MQRADLLITAPSPSEWHNCSKKLAFYLEDCGLARDLYDGNAFHTVGIGADMRGVVLRHPEADIDRAVEILDKAYIGARLHIQKLPINPEDDRDYHDQIEKKLYPAGDTTKRAAKSKDRVKPSILAEQANIRTAAKKAAEQLELDKQEARNQARREAARAKTNLGIRSSFQQGDYDNDPGPDVLGGRIADPSESASNKETGKETVVRRGKFDRWSDIDPES
jgi:hypothetical protein